jgi:hypothetical protein
MKKKSLNYDRSCGAGAVSRCSSLSALKAQNPMDGA